MALGPARRFPSEAARTLRARAPAILLAACAAASSVLAAVPPAVRGAHGMVVSQEPSATAAGLEVLRAGGNAVDAAIATAFALAATHPVAGNPGGGGFLLYRTPEGRHLALDFRETAPARLTPQSFLDASGRPIEGASLDSGLAVGVPGTIAGLAEAHQRWGTQAWADLVAPGIRLAEQGFPVGVWLAGQLRNEAERLGRDPGARAIFFDADGRPFEEGERLVQSDLAGTLRRVAAEGVAGFYAGPVAEAFTQSVLARGGVMAASDLAGYRVRERRPIEGRYRGFRVVTFPPPSGGVVLLEILGMLERFDLPASGWGSSATVHRIVEAERRAFADRARWLGDPDFVDVPVARLLDPAYLARRAAEIRPRRATPSRKVGAGVFAPPESEHTLHVSVGDPAGGAVALTITLNTAFGTASVAEGTGVLLNNEMDDFALAPERPNHWGLVGGTANVVAPGKRPQSSMTPTIVERPGGGPRPALVLGSPGGSKIVTSVLQVLLGVIDHHVPLAEAVDAPRFHHQWLPDRIDFERHAFCADVLRALAAAGHALEQTEGSLGSVNAIGLDDEGRWLGAADPRRHCVAAGF